ncbi:hypothetical protein HIM_00769 [Hirsutella minnesotensis 3608]|nr:hypothetical protein HIM_00769 [Hirsutella minnesotensis 3608]
MWRPPQRSLVALDRKLWCKYIVFEGRRYVSSLSNVGSQKHPELLFSPASQTADHLHIAEDHLGIVELTFCGLDGGPVHRETPDIWWRNVPLSEVQSNMECISDGIKLRRLEVAGLTSIAWSIPQHRHVRLEYFGDQPQKSPDRMVAFSCNHPENVGYSVLWDGKMKLIHAHQDEGDISIYETRASSRAVWLYMPVAFDAIITHIYQGHGRLDRDKALGIRTNKDRYFLAGVYLKNLPRQWVLTDQPSQEPSRIFYESSASGINTLAFQNQFRPISGQSFRVPNLSTNPLLLQEDYFYTSSRLAGLTSITPCKRQGSEAILGLLLSFTDGHKNVVGQVRFDSLAQPIEVYEGLTVFLGFRRLKLKYPYAAEISAVFLDPDSEFETVIQLSSDGVLEWLWSHQQCHVIYQGQKSPMII